VLTGSSGVVVEDAWRDPCDLDLDEETRALEFCRTVDGDPEVRLYWGMEWGRPEEVRMGSQVWRELDRGVMRMAVRAPVLASLRVTVRVNGEVVARSPTMDARVEATVRQKAWKTPGWTLRVEQEHWVVLWENPDHIMSEGLTLVASGSRVRVDDSAKGLTELRAFRVVQALSSMEDIEEDIVEGQEWKDSLTVTERQVVMPSVEPNSTISPNLTNTVTPTASPAVLTPRPSVNSTPSIAPSRSPTPVPMTSPPTLATPSSTTVSTPFPSSSPTPNATSSNTSQSTPTPTETSSMTTPSSGQRTPMPSPSPPTINPATSPSSSDSGTPIAAGGGTSNGLIIGLAVGGALLVVLIAGGLLLLACRPGAGGSSGRRRRDSADGGNPTGGVIGSGESPEGGSFLTTGVTSGGGAGTRTPPIESELTLGSDAAPWHQSLEEYDAAYRASMGTGSVSGSKASGPSTSKQETATTEFMSMATSSGTGDLLDDSPANYGAGRTTPMRPRTNNGVNAIPTMPSTMTSAAQYEPFEDPDTSAQYLPFEVDGESPSSRPDTTAKLMRGADNVVVRMPQPRAPRDEF